jgi:hypothetical protein
MMRSCWDQVSFAGEINADEYDVLGNKFLTWRILFLTCQLLLFQYLLSCSSLSFSANLKHYLVSQWICRD